MVFFERTRGAEPGFQFLDNLYVRVSLNDPLEDQEKPKDSEKPKLMSFSNALLGGSRRMSSAWTGCSPEEALPTSVIIRLTSFALSRYESYFWSSRLAGEVGPRTAAACCACTCVRGLTPPCPLCGVSAQPFAAAGAPSFPQRASFPPPPSSSREAAAWRVLS